MNNNKNKIRKKLKEGKNRKDLVQNKDYFLKF